MDRTELYLIIRDAFITGYIKAIYDKMYFGGQNILPPKEGRVFFDFTLLKNRRIGFYSRFSFDGLDGDLIYTFDCPLQEWGVKTEEMEIWAEKITHALNDVFRSGSNSKYFVCLNHETMDYVAKLNDR